MVFGGVLWCSVVFCGVQLPQPFLEESPKGTVLGPLLFLFFFNDLPSVVSSTTRLFADDCLLYRRIRTTEEQAILQRDLNNLQQWENNWLKRFNPDKCEVLIATNKTSPIHSEYAIHGQVLNQTDSAKY